jgi:hypothetical protein
LDPHLSGTSLRSTEPAWICLIVVVWLYSASTPVIVALRRDSEKVINVATAALAVAVSITVAYLLRREGQERRKATGDEHGED